jgi:hypothetical protein
MAVLYGIGYLVASWVLNRDWLNAMKELIFRP